MLQTTNPQPLKTETEPALSLVRRPSLAQVAGLVSIVFGLVAVARVCQIILTVGGNNISNDYIDVVPFMNLAFSGQIDSSNLLSNFKVGQHVVALPIALHLLSAWLFDWNARAELIIGVGINLFKALLLWDLLASGLKKEWRPLVFGIVLSLVFSMTQASVHFFGQACFPVSLTTLGFTIALWGILRFQNDWRGVFLMLVGGVGSALSMGNVPPCWFALLLGLIFYGYRASRWRTYLLWATGAIVSIAPYLYLVSLNPNVMKYCQHGFNAIFFVNLLGRPFANQIGLQVGRLPMSEFAGLAGLAMFALALIANLRQKRFSLPFKTSLILSAYGLSSVAMLSCVRLYVCPWYCTFSTYFWIGLIGLFLCALQSNSDAAPVSAKRADLVWKVIGILCLSVIPILYLASNRSWEDKHVYLSTRAPASEAALRNFREAPSYIESLLFQWGDGRPKNVTRLALAPERYQLSAFSPDQTWTLQGDFVLPRVRVFNVDRSPPVRFLEDKTADHTVAWSHYEHANLYVHAPNTVSWTFSMPADMHSARFKTAFTIGSPAKRVKPAITDGVTGKIFAVVGDPLSTTSKELLKEVHASKAGEWLPIDIDLIQFKGKTVTLVFTSDGGKDKQDDYSVFQYPSIDVKLRRRSAEENRALAAQLDANPQLWRPINSDLRENFGKNFVSKMEFPSLTDARWKSSMLSLAVPGDIEGNAKGQSKFRAMTYTPSKSIAIDEYSHLLVSMKAPKTLIWKSLRVDLLLSGGKRFTFSVPLPADSASHVCSYELKLCQMPGNSHLEQVVLYPVAPPGAEPEGVARYALTVNSVALVKEKSPAWLGH